MVIHSNGGCNYGGSDRSSFGAAEGGGDNGDIDDRMGVVAVVVVINDSDGDGGGSDGGDGDCGGVLVMVAVAIEYLSWPYVFTKVICLHPKRLAYIND
jgi:hypothetical protein